MMKSISSPMKLWPFGDDHAQSRVFMELIFVLFRDKISEFRKIVLNALNISRLIFIIIREWYVN